MATPSGREGGVADGGTCTVLRTPSMETVSVVMVCIKRVLAHKLVDRKECIHKYMYMHTCISNMYMYMELFTLL